jgi:Ca-activated chloride channel homolog
MIMPAVTLANGIMIPVELGEWERQSMPLQVSEPYQGLFQEFAKYFKGEARSIGDQNLQQEQLILEKLSRSEGASQKSES